MEAGAAPWRFLGCRGGGSQAAEGWAEVAWGGYPQDIESGALGELERVGEVQTLYPLPLDIDRPVVALGGRVWKALDLVGWVRAAGGEGWCSCPPGGLGR